MDRRTDMAENLVAAEVPKRQPRRSLDVDWAWARIFSDYEYRPAVFTDVHGRDNTIQYATPAFSDLTGYELDEVVGQDGRLLQGPDTDPGAVSAIRGALSQNLPITVDILNYRKDGAPFWNRLRVRPVIGRGGIVRRHIGVLSPINEANVRPGAFLRFRV